MTSASLDKEADAALIAAMRNALPLLLDVVDAARALNMTTPETADDPLTDLDAALAALDGAA